jgi:hypothetical protein
VATDLVPNLELLFLIGTALTLAAGALGVAVAQRLPPWLSLAERLVCGLVTAVVGLDLLGLLLALPLGLHAPVPLLLAGLAAMAAVWLVAGRPAWRAGLARGWAAGGWLPGTLPERRLLAAVILLGAALAFLFGRVIEVTPDAWLAHYNNTWSDWSFHAAYTTTFVYGQNFPPQNPLFAGTPFRYPFAPDFASALLVAGGWSLPAALTWPAWAMATLALSGLILWARRLAGNLASGIIAVLLTLLGGGLGFWFFLGDAARLGLTTALLHAPQAYDRYAPPVNIQWYNPILSYYLPQRSFDFGAAIVVAVLLLLTTALQETPLLGWRQAVIGFVQARRRLDGQGAAFLLAGALAGLLPWFHVHSLLVLGIVTITWALLWPRPAWLLFAALVCLLAIPRLAAAIPGDVSAPAGLHYPRLDLGWMANEGLSGSDLLALPVVWAWFWIKNTGLFLPLLLVALVTRFALSLRSRLLLAPFLAVFLVANLVVFQPWDWDNTKVLVFWYLASGVAVGALLVFVARRWPAAWIGSSLVGVTLLASGALSLIQWLPPQGPTFSWFSREDIELADFVRGATDPHAVFLTGDEVTNPIPDLAGRPVLMSYRGWLWTYGIDYSRREADIAEMYIGAPDSLDLLHRYGVNYVLVGPQERSAWHADPGFFDRSLPLLTQTEHYRIYIVPPPLPD